MPTACNSPPPCHAMATPPPEGLPPWLALECPAEGQPRISNQTLLCAQEKLMHDMVTFSRALQVVEVVQAAETHKRLGKMVQFWSHSMF